MQNTDVKSYCRVVAAWLCMKHAVSVNRNARCVLISLAQQTDHKYHSCQRPASSCRVQSHVAGQVTCASKLATALASTEWNSNSLLVVPCSACPLTRSTRANIYLKWCTLDMANTCTYPRYDDPACVRHERAYALPAQVDCVQKQTPMKHNAYSQDQDINPLPN